MGGATLACQPAVASHVWTIVSSLSGMAWAAPTGTSPVPAPRRRRAVGPDLVGRPADAPHRPELDPATAHGLPADPGDAVTALFEVHYVHLVRLARHLLDEPADAEDVVMDAFAGLALHWSRVRRTGEAFFYLRSSVVNGCRSRLRRLRVARARMHTQLERDAAPAEQQAMLHLEHDAVAAVLRELPRRQREVLVLRYYEEASEAEIADVLGVTTGSVKVHASRGLRAVASRLEVRG
jgi:RNA polymerase sigma-70 factor (sigma-E family)